MNYTILIAWFIASATGTWPSIGPIGCPFDLSCYPVIVVDSITTNSVPVVDPVAGTTNYVDVVTTNSHYEDRLAITRWDVQGVEVPSLANFTAADMATAQAAYEAHKQAKKPLKLKQAENNYIDMCDILREAVGEAKTKKRMDSDSTTAKIKTLKGSNWQSAVEVAIQMLSSIHEVEVQGGRWDDVEYHEGE